MTINYRRASLLDRKEPPNMVKLHNSLYLYFVEGKQMQLLLNTGGPDRVSRVQMAEAVACARGYSTSLINPVSASSVWSYKDLCSQPLLFRLLENSKDLFMLLSAFNCSSISLYLGRPWCQVTSRYFHGYNEDGTGHGYLSDCLQ